MTLHTRVKEEHSLYISQSLRVCGLPRILIKVKPRVGYSGRVTAKKAQ